MDTPDVVYLEEILAEVKRLDAKSRRAVLEFARDLTPPQGVPGSTLLRFAGAMPADDIVRIEEAIQELEEVETDGE